MIEHSRFKGIAVEPGGVGVAARSGRLLTLSLLVVVLAGCARWPTKTDGAPDGGCVATASQWYQRGNEAAESGQLERAANAYKRALAINPDMGRARHNLGLVYLRLGTRNIVQARRVLPPDDQQSEDTAAYLRCLVDALTTGDTESCGP